MKGYIRLPSFSFITIRLIFDEEKCNILNHKISLEANIKSLWEAKRIQSFPAKEKDSNFIKL